MFTACFNDRSEWTKMCAQAAQVGKAHQNTSRSSSMRSLVVNSASISLGAQKGTCHHEGLHAYRPEGQRQVGGAHQ